MTLPFTREQFLDEFGRYNHALWPFASVLWLATLVSVVRLLRGSDAHGVLLLVFVAKRPGRSRLPTRKLWKQP